MCVKEGALIGLIDVDGHNYPNLCLMKLSAYHKSIGDQVEWYTADGDKQYDIVYMSKVFGDAYSPDIPEPTNADRVIKGGTGYAIKLEDGKEVYHKELDPPLPSEVENIYPDYSLYPEYTGYGKPLKKQTAYGFLTRGCPRGCAFCHVVAKEGRCARKVADLSQFWSGQGTICLSDPNILACPELVDLLTQLRDSGAKIEFNQGLDARLITPQKAELLASMNLKVPHFAMDTMSSLEPVKKGIRLYVDACKRLKGKWNWRNAKVFCLTNFDTTHEQDMQRISAIQECECQPYVMIYNKPSAPPITRRLQRWTNSTMLYAKTQDFMEYQRMNYKTVLEGSGEKKMRLIVYDCEVFCEDWLVIFKDIETGKYTVIHNDNEELKECINDDTVYVSFNGKHYDQFIIKAICCGFTPQEVKQVNDFIIGGGQGWECPMLRDFFFRFNNVDIKDDMQMGLSLKAIEGHLGMNIKETEVSFDLDRPLTEEELRQTIHYCKHDVDATHELMKLRADYLRTKKNLGKRAGIDEVKSLSATNAKLTAMMLRAERKEWNDGRDYVYPENLDLSVIPQPILDFFDTIHDMSIPDEQLFKTSFEIEIGGMLCKYAWGGVHGSLTAYFEEAVGDRIIQNRDVSSLYPSLIEIYNYLSRNVPDPELFYAIKRDRIEAKHTGDKQTAKDLKLPLNTVSGAQENKYNDLYDPLPTRSLRISGQLFLTVLTMRLLNACKTIKLLNLNTDGLMYSIDKSELPIVDRIASEWEAETKFELETDNVQKVWIKDVNNLLMIKTDGEVKTVGGYLNYGISVKGAWSINNNMVIVKKALIEYFVNDTPVEETVNGSTDIFEFQLIAKAGAKYREAYHLVNGEKVPVQKVNRVYATKDERYGKLFKVKAENDSTAKIEMLPEHCIIDNDNHLTIDDVDKTFYIEMAKKRINDFLGIKPEKKTRGGRKKMTTTKKTETAEITAMNIYQKLLKARAMFLEADVKKTGKNMHLSFKYFELEDIVPTATRIFGEVGIVPLVNFTADTATMTMVNTDNPEETVTFVSPFNQIAPIVSNAGKQATNEMMALGSSITYMRRYLYMIALDICESDGIDANAGVPAPAAPAPKAPPATPEQRQEVKQELTAPADNATALQIKGLKAVLKKLKDADPSKEELIADIAVQTQGFTVISKEDCETLINKISEMLEG